MFAYKLKGKKGVFCKLDFEKDYDPVNWQENRFG